MEAASHLRVVYVGVPPTQILHPHLCSVDVELQLATLCLQLLDFLLYRLLQLQDLWLRNDG